MKKVINERESKFSILLYQSSMFFHYTKNSKVLSYKKNSYKQIEADLAHAGLNSGHVKFS